MQRIATPDSAKSETLENEDRPSFSSLVDEHQGKLYNFLYRLCGNKEDAEDLTQDTFVKAYRFFHRYDPNCSFAAWLYTIGRRTALNHFRKSKKTEELCYDIVDSATRPDDQTEQDDQKNSIWESAKKLKKVYQEVLVYKYMEDLSIKEIASVMGKSQTNIKILLFRARNKLKTIHPKQA